MKRRSNRSNTNSLRKNDNEDGRNTKSQNKNNEQQQRLRTRPEHRPNAFPVTTSASENNAEMTAPKRTRRSVVVSGPIKFFEETKKRKATTSSDDRRTRRKSTRSSAQRPFHHSKVLIIVDGMIEKIGSISSANSSSSSSVSSSASSSTSKEVALHSDEAIRETENSHGSVKEDLQQSHEKSENNTDTDGHHVDETTDESDGDDNVQKSMLENEHCLRKDAEQTKAVVKTKEGKNKTISVPNRNERMYTQNNVDENVENDEHLDDEHPVKEIDTSKFFDEKDDACSDDEHSRRLRSKRNRNEQRCDSSKGQNHLDEQTLSLLKECLQDDIWRHECNRIGRYRCDQLDDDDIEQFMVRMTRIADDQANQKVILLAGESSDCEFYDFAMYRECLNDAQERTLGQEYLRRIVSKIQKEYLVHHPYSKRGECLNKRTLNWFKRAVGFLGKRKLDDSRHCVNSKPPRMTGDDEGAEIVDNTNSRRSPDEDSNNGNGKLKSRTIVTRRYTRDMAISSRNQRKVKGLEILCCAIDDLEVELDNVTDSSDNSVPQSSKVAANASALELSGTGASSYTKCGIIAESWCDGIRRNKPPTRSAGYVMMAPKAAERMTNPDKKMRANASLQDTSRFGNRSPARATIHDVDVREPQHPKICTSLRQLDLLWREREALKPPEARETVTRRIESEESFRKRSSIELDPQFREAGIVHRLPRWDNFVRKESKSFGREIYLFDPPRTRHSDGTTYAEFCSRLMNCLQGRARLFTKCEFFYSDLDRAWYNDNVFARDAERLGIPRGAMLSRNEWKAVRRRMTKKPRLFSKKFIASQFSKRNQYRNSVRMLQRNVDAASKVRFPYDVPAPIAVGTTVNAYSKNYRIVQRGTVMTFDYETALYLILFENRQFGYELCPDSDVATCGPPKILVHCARETTRGNWFDDEIGQVAYDEGTVFETSYSNRAPNLNVKQEVAKILGADRSENAARRSLTEEVAENEAFSVLLTIIERASCRKKDLLSIIEKINTLVKSQVPSGQVNHPAQLDLSESAREHFDWILANLDRVNQVLATAMKHLRLLYGDAYLSTIPHRSLEDFDKQRFLEEYIQECQDRKTLPSSKIVNTLLNESEHVGRKLSSSVWNRQSMLKPSNHGGRFLQSRLRDVGQLLCASKFAQENAVGNDYLTSSNEATVALKVVTSKLLATNFPEMNDGSNEIYKRALAIRDDAMNELQSSVKLLIAELELSDVAKNLYNKTSYLK